MDERPASVGVGAIDAPLPLWSDRRILGSDPHDFAGLYIRLWSQLAALARRNGADGPDVDEILQEAFLRMFLSLPELEYEAQVVAYARRTVTNLCIDRARARGRTPLLIPLDQVPTVRLGAAEDDDPVIAAEDAAIVLQALARLSPLHRAALVKREIEEKALPLIAAELGVPDEQMKHVLHRARRALRRLLVGTAVDPAVDDEVGVAAIAAHRLASAGKGVLVLALLVGMALVGGNVWRSSGSSHPTSGEAPVGPQLVRVPSPGTAAGTDGSGPVATAPAVPAPVTTSGALPDSAGSVSGARQAPIASNTPSASAPTVVALPAGPGTPAAKPTPVTGAAPAGTAAPVIPPSTGSPAVGGTGPVVDGLGSPVTGVTGPSGAQPFTMSGLVNSTGPVSVAAAPPTNVPGGRVAMSRFAAAVPGGNVTLDQTLSQSSDGSTSVRIVPTVNHGAQSVQVAQKLTQASVALTPGGLSVDVSVVTAAQVLVATGPDTSVSVGGLTVSLTYSPDLTTVTSEHLVLHPGLEGAAPAASPSSGPGTTPTMSGNVLAATPEMFASAIGPASCDSLAAAPGDRASQPSSTSVSGDGSEIGGASGDDPGLLLSSLCSERTNEP